MRVLTFVLTLFVFAGTVQAQNEIAIDATADVVVPADEILFQITLNAEASTPQEAHKLHQEREKVLVEQLKKHDISEENIHFEPISIKKTYSNDYPKGERQRAQTRQNITLSLDDFGAYEQIQITLIENGFDEFSGEFSSTETVKAEDKALKKALEIAREKADIIASETGLTISGIKNINYSYNQRPPQPMQMEMRAKSADSSLLQFDQTVSVSASVSVTYNFEEQE